MRRLGRYALLTRLASGDISDVFLARLEAPIAGDASLAVGSSVVVKLLRSDLVADPEVSARLLDDGAHATRFAHPNLIRVLEVGQSRSDFFVCLAYVAGQPLSAVLRRVMDGGLDTATVMLLGADIASALAYLHEPPEGLGAPLVHAGVSPNSVIVGYDGRLLLTGATSSGVRRGRPPSRGRLGYSCPELVAGRPVDARGDLFSLGVLLHDTLTGRRLYRRDTEAETRAAVMDRAVAPIRAELSGVPAAVANVICEMVRPDPDDRPQSAASVEAIFRREVQGRESDLVRSLADLMGARFKHEKAAQTRVFEAAFRRARDADRASGGLLIPALERAQISKLRSAASAPARSRQEFDAGDDPAAATVEHPLPDFGAEVTTKHPRPDDITPSTQRASAQGRRAAELEPTAREPTEPEPIEREPTEPEPIEPVEDDAERTGRMFPPRVGRYVLREHLGQSHCGDLFRARDPNVGRRVLLEVVNADEDAKITMSTRIALMRREAQLTGALSHRALPLLYDAGRDGQLYFLVHRYVTGVFVDELVSRQGRLSAEQVRLVAARLAGALNYLHERELTHGDIRPGSVLIDEDGSPHIANFTLTSMFSDDGHPMRSGLSVSLVPEYLHAGVYDARSDQFALGALLYLVLTGREPFRGPDDDAIRAAILMHQPPAPRNVEPECDEWLSAIVTRMLDKDPSRRFEDMQAVLTEIEGVSEHASRAPTPVDVLFGAEPEAEPTIVVVEDGLPALEVERVLAEGGVVAAVRPTLDGGLEALSRSNAGVLVVNEDLVADELRLRARIAESAPQVELRMVEPLGRRLLGARLDPAEMGDTFASMMGRIEALRDHDDGRSSHEEALDAIRSVCQRRELAATGTMACVLAYAYRALAARLNDASDARALAASAPPEVQAVLGPVDRILNPPEDQPSATAPIEAKIVAVVERYYEATTNADVTRRKSPRKALLDLRGDADEGRMSDWAVEALVSHLRDVYSELVLPVKKPPQRRVFLFGHYGEHDHHAALSEAGLSVDSLNGDVMAAWQELSGGDFDVAIIGDEVSDANLETLIQRLRADSTTKDTPVVMLRPVGDRSASGIVGLDAGASSARLLDVVTAVLSRPRRVTEV